MKWKEKHKDKCWSAFFHCLFYLYITHWSTPDDSIKSKFIGFAHSIEMEIIIINFVEQCAHIQNHFLMNISLRKIIWQLHFKIKPPVTQAMLFTMEPSVHESLKKENSHCKTWLKWIILGSLNLKIKTATFWLNTLAKSFYAPHIAT